MSTFADLNIQKPHPIGICRVAGCDQKTAGQIVLQIREGRKPYKAIGSRATAFCEAHAVERFNAMVSALDGGT